MSGLDVCALCGRSARLYGDACGECWGSWRAKTLAAHADEEDLFDRLWKEKPTRRLRVARESTAWPARRPDPYLEELRQRWPNAERLVAAFQLAPDVNTCSDLLAGVPVSAGRLDQEALFESRRRSLVTLSAPVDLLNVTEESM